MKRDIEIPINAISVPPPEEHSDYSVSMLMRYYFELSTLQSQEAFASAISQGYSSKKVEGGVISTTVVGHWLRDEEPVSNTYKKAFFWLLNKLCRQEVKRQWRNAFEAAWARHRAKTEPFNSALDAHSAWIKKRYDRPLLGEDFPIKQIYVPIKLLAEGWKEGIEDREQVFSDLDLLNFARYGFKESSRKLDQAADWVFVKGGPGSGKSALALTLATKLSDGAKKSSVMFLRGAQLSGEKRPLNLPVRGDIDDTIETKELIDAFLASSKQHLTLIVDGLDEIGTMRGKGRDLFLHHLSELEKYCERIRASGKSTRALIFGRNTVTDIAASSFSHPCRLLEMGDLSGATVKIRTENNHHSVYGDDLRPLWWSRYLKAKKVEPDHGLPDFLTNAVHPLFELGREPLILFLVLRASWPQDSPVKMVSEEVRDVVDAYAAGSNRNTIYADIIEKIRHGKDWKETGVDLLDPKSFTRVLRHMALACWQQNNERLTTVAGIRAVIQDEATENAFDSILFDLNEDRNRSLVTAFYYQFKRTKGADGLDLSVDDYEIEFVHKTFVEYLVATFLFDLYEELLDLLAGRKPDEARAEAERKFVTYVLAGAMSQEIAVFAFDEAKARFDPDRWNVWAQTPELVREISNLRIVADTPSSDYVEYTSALERLIGAGQILQMLYGCLIRARYVLTGERVRFDEHADGFDSQTLCQLATPMDLGQFADGIEEGKVGPDSALAASLSGIEWKGAALPGVLISGGTIEGSTFENSVFEGTVWHDLICDTVSICDSNFSRCRFKVVIWKRSALASANLQQCSFNQGNIEDTTLDHVNAGLSAFDGVHFVDCRDIRMCDFSQAWFGDCLFSNCTFIECDFQGTHFADCTFEECTFERCAVEGSNLQDVADTSFFKK